MSDSSKQRIHPSVLKVLSDINNAEVPVSQRARQSFRSLDRSLKSFLKSSNLPGLEYRLRLAGYNALSDLLDADIEMLCAHGFTPIMARRLLRALEEYVIGSLNQSEEDFPLPFQLVRKGQKINSDPTEKMKAMPTYGKQNVKRQRFIVSPKMAKKRSSSKGNKMKNPNPKQPVSYVRLMSEDSLPSEPIFPNVLPGNFGISEEAGGRDSRESGEELAVSEDLRGSEDELAVNTEPNTALRGSGDELAGGDEATAAASGHSEDEAVALPSETTSQNTTTTTTTTTTGDLSSLETRAGGDRSPLPGSPGLPGRGRGRENWRRSVPVFQEFFMPDEIDTGERWTSSDEMGRRLKRCSSVPADFRFHSSADAGMATSPSPAAVHQPWCMLVRSYSCPASLAVPPSQIESTLIKLSTSQELPVIESSLRLLCSLAKGLEVNRKEVRESGGLEVAVDLLVTLCTHPRVVSSCFKLIKFLTREGMYRHMYPRQS